MWTYRQLNVVIESDSSPLPLIQDIFDLVDGSAIYSILNLKAGYYQMYVAEEDFPKTAFTCNARHCEFKKVPFGLKTAPNFFKKEINKIFADLIGKCVFVYIDDILVFSKNEKEHVSHLRLVFDRLREEHVSHLRLVFDRLREEHVSHLRLVFDRLREEHVRYLRLVFDRLREEHVRHLQLVFDRHREEHVRHLQLVFDRLREEHVRHLQLVFDRFRQEHIRH